MDNYRAIRTELDEYGHGLAECAELVAVSKAELPDAKLVRDHLAAAIDRDVILFSVRRGSAVIGELDSMLGIPIVEGDILSPPDEEGDPPAIFVPAEALGLVSARGKEEPGDDLDALDLPEPGSSLGLVLGGALLSWLRRRRGRC